MHRTFEVLLAAYLGFEFALGRDKPDKTPNAVTRAIAGDRYARELHVSNYLELMLQIAKYGDATRLHPAYERLLVALGGPPSVDKDENKKGVWSILNEHRNRGVMGHGRESLEQFAASWARARKREQLATSPDPPATTFAEVAADAEHPPSLLGGGSPVDGRAPTDGTLSAPGESSFDATTLRVRRRTAHLVLEPRPQRARTADAASNVASAADAIDDYTARLIRLAECCQSLLHSAHFDDTIAADLLARLDWRRLTYCAWSRSAAAP